MHVFPAFPLECTRPIRSPCSDPDPQDSLLFEILSGNEDGVFRIAACKGQIRVARAVLDYVAGPRTYTLSVIVRDDATPQLSATATFVIHVVHVNNPPVCVQNPPAMTVPEMSPPLSTIGLLNAAYVSDRCGLLSCYRRCCLRCCL